jgi:hypothetical protein
VFVIALVLWIPALINPQTLVFENTENTMLFNVFDRLLSQIPRIRTIVAFVFLLTQLFFFNLILQSNNLITKNSSAAAFVFVLLFSLAPLQTGFYPFVMINPLLLIMLHSAFVLYELEDIEFPVFKVSLLASVISLFYFPAILLLCYIWIVLFIIRASSSRIWIISLIGFLCPYFFIASYFYLTDQLTSQIDLFLDSFDRFGLPAFNFFSWSVIAVITLILILFFYALNIVYSTNSDKKINLRKKIALAISMFIMAISMFFFTQTPVAQNSFLFVGMAIIISIAMSQLNKSRFMNIALFVLLILLLINNYQTLF